MASTDEIRLPGFGLPVNKMPDYLISGRHWRPDDPRKRERFPNAITDWAASNILVREQNMLGLINELTDKPDWHRKVHDEQIVSKWKKEAMEREGFDCSEKMFDFCVSELRDKAARFEDTGRVIVLDTDAGVVKSDSAIPSSLADELKAAVKPLEDIPDRLKDWHPDSNDLVLDIVHPSLYPLMYGKSRVLPSGGLFLHDALDHCGSGVIVSEPKPEELDLGGEDNETLVNDRLRGSYGDANSGLGYWSGSYQWLPSEIAFRDKDKVEITSYINNLHPRHTELYGVLEKIIAKTIPLWNDCLSYLLSEEVRWRITAGDSGAEYLYPEGEERPLDEGEDEESDDRWERDEQWIRDTRVLVPPDVEDYVSWNPEVLDSVNLQRDWKEKGLQVIVKLANIELRPEEGKSEYAGGTWHIEGQLNEHICASAIYYYDQANVTDSRLAFRQLTNPSDVEEEPYAQYDYEGLEQLYGIQHDGPTVQTLGSVLTREGRLLVFPNVLQHQVQPFGLTDPTEPGHRKILALFLADPHIRTLSTANVPPQQRDWWSEVVRQERMGKLPQELIDQVLEMTDEWPISLEEAKEVRKDLMSKRRIYVDKVNRDYEFATFSFCEH